MNHRRTLAWGSALLILTAGIAAAAEAERLTLDWIYSDEGKTATAMPDVAWIDSGQLLLYDKQPPKAERTIETFDSESGKRVKRVDQKKAMESLTALLEPEEPLEELGWPDIVDPNGRWGAYVKEDNLFLLDLDSSEVVAVSATDAVEKSPRFSPDGNALAFVRANDLYLYDLETKKTKRLTEDGSDSLLNGTVSWVYWEEIFGRGDRGYEWSPDSKSIAYLQTDESGVGLMSYVDFKPNVPKVIHQRYPKTGEANPRVRAGVLELESGKTTWVDLGVYPYEYLVRVNWLSDSARLAVQTLDRPQTTLDLFLVDVATGKASHLLRETDPGWVNLHDDLHFLDDDGGFLWVSERTGYAHLYLYDMTGKLVRQLTRGDWALRASSAVFWARKTVAHVEDGQVYFTGLEKSSIEKHLYRIGLDGTGMKRISEETGTHRIRFRPDGKYYLDEHSANERFPELVLRSPDGKAAHTVATSRKERLEPFDLQPRQLFEIEAADGFRMPALMIRPRGFDPEKKYPVVIYVYGGPSAPTVSDSWYGRARNQVEQMLADRGFVVLYVDNRSATAISKTLENRILEEGYGSVELADLLDAVSWLKAQSYVDPERVGIWGWSGGGSYTLLALTSSKEFRAGIAVAAVSDWRYYDSIWAEAFMKRPQDNPAGYDKTSHAERAKDLHGRLLLVHGTYDDNVHPQNAWRFTDELIDAGITFDMMIYPMRKHGIRDDEAQKHLYRTMLEFWERNLR
jgi:dipeptidyl-peptidase-4